MLANFTIPNDSFQENNVLDVFTYPGVDHIQTFKHPQRFNAPLKGLLVISRQHPFDKIVQWPYGQAWESPGYIESFAILNRPNNKERLQNLCRLCDVTVNYMQPDEYIAKYRDVYEKPFPYGVYTCEPEYDYYTVQRLRHMVYFKRDVLSEHVKSFLEGIGKIMGAGHSITQKQREYIRSLLVEYYTSEHQHLPKAYDTLNRGTPNEFKLPF